MDITRLILDNLLIIIFFILTIIAFVVLVRRSRRPETAVPPEICATEREPDDENFVRCPVCNKVNEFPRSDKSLSQ